MPIRPVSFAIHNLKRTATTAKTALEEFEMLTKQFGGSKSCHDDGMRLLTQDEKQCLEQLAIPLGKLNTYITGRSSNNIPFNMSCFDSNDIELFDKAINTLDKLTTDCENNNGKSQNSGKITFLKFLTGICMVGAVVALIALLPPVTIALPLLATLSLVSMSCEIGFLGLGAIVHGVSELYSRSDLSKQSNSKVVHDKIKNLHSEIVNLCSLASYEQNVKNEIIKYDEMHAKVKDEIRIEIKEEIRAEIKEEMNRRENWVKA